MAWPKTLRHEEEGIAKNHDFCEYNCPGQKLKFSVRASMSYFGEFMPHPWLCRALLSHFS